MSEKLEVISRNSHQRHPLTVCVFQVRSRAGGSVIVLTDKPQKPIPWDAAAAARFKLPTTDSVFQIIGVVASAIARDWPHNRTPEESEALAAARYVGWAWESSLSQRGWTPAGAEAFERFNARTEKAEEHNEAREPALAGCLF